MSLVSFYCKVCETNFFPEKVTLPYDKKTDVLCTHCKCKVGVFIPAPTEKKPVKQEKQQELPLTKVEKNEVHDN